MSRYFVIAALLFGLTACIKSSPDPVYVNQIDAYFNNANDRVYKAAGQFKRPVPYKVGQYVVTGISSSSERSVSRMAIVGQEMGGWIIETHSLTPTSEGITQMLVRGLDQVYQTGTIDAIDIVWVKVKPAGQEVQTFEGALLTMTEGLYKKSLAGLEVQFDKLTQSETVKVPAGSFKGALKARSEVAFMNRRYLSDAWFHPAVPINGMVKSVSPDYDTSMVLLDFGLSGAKRSF